MGLFGRRRRPSVTRVAEGGPEPPLPTTPSPSSVAPAASAAVPKKKPDESLDLFGADSDDSDDDATIDRYANGATPDDDDDAPDEQRALEAESKKVSTLLSKLSPEELFRKYDTDGSGNISATEFIAMLPDLGINMSDAKAMRIFRKCDTDGGGEIDLSEFKMAMFAVDPVSGNTLGFSPSSLLTPQDAFELFDADGTGQIDELEFADVLEYFGMDVSDEKQEALFRKYDKDKSGYIDYKEFRAMWLRLANVREELAKRGVEVPKYAALWTLQQMLEKVLDEEEARETLVLAEAQQFLCKQREKERRVLLGKKALVRAQDELAAALDAAGQVYIFGGGKYEQFSGEPVMRDEEDFPGFAAVREIWSFRVNPTPLELEKAGKPAGSEPKAREAETHDNEAGKHTSKPGAGGIDNGVVQRKKALRKLAESKPKLRDLSKFVRRRPENKRWKFQSPPKLNRQSVQALQRYRHSRYEDEDDERNTGSDAAMSATNKEGADSEVEPIAQHERGDEDDTLRNEELAKLFFEDREFVRSLRFRLSRIMANTGLLWGRGVQHAALSENVAFAVTSAGTVLTWGGKNSSTSWEAMVKTSTIGFGDDNSDSESDDSSPAPGAGDEAAPAKLTARSAMQKMATPMQLRGLKDPDIEAREEELIAEQLRDQEANQRYETLKRVVVYYGVWEPPPSNATRFLFMEQVLVPKLDFEVMRQSALLRGLEVERITKLDLILLLGGCFELEVEIRGVDGHEAFRATEELIQTHSLDKHSKLLEPVDALFHVSECLDLVLELSLGKISERYERSARVQMEDVAPEFTTRGENFRIELNGITTRGPPLHSPRGRAAVAGVSAGGSHVALLFHDGSVYTWGNGASGRLGHQQNEFGKLCYDSDHPQRVLAFKDVNIRYVSCAHSHSAATSSDGDLYTWGSAVSGKLGVGLSDDTYEQFAAIPLLVKFPGKRRIRSVSCGAAHTGAVSTAGELFMWGSANGGRLGLGVDVTDTVVVPTLVRELATKRKVRAWQVSCGTTHSAVCTEVASSFESGSKKLQGGHVFVCGSATPLGRHVPTWEPVPELDGVGIRQVACGVAHSAAVSAYGELYTWGTNRNGCTGHAITRTFLARPKLLKSLHIEPYNLALGKPCRQLNVYNEQGPQLAVNGDVSGKLATCIHTHLEEKPWWEVNLGQPAVIERVRVWNRTDTPLNPSKSRDEYASRLFPFWILVSEFPFKDLEGKEGLRAAKVQSGAFGQFDEVKRMTEWVLPTANTVGQYVRVQLQKRNFLHVAEVEVFGVYSAFKTVGRVGAVHCTHDATMVVVPPTSHDSVLEDYYLRAIQADADNATILRQFQAFELAHSKFGRGGAELLSGPCRLCRVFRQCEICELYSQTTLQRHFQQGESSGELPSRVVGDRKGLQELIAMVVDDGQLEAEEQEKLRARAEAARQEALECNRTASDDDDHVRSNDNDYDDNGS
ncbi:hypothetical protein PybrP1_012879 [[Pythium] brassicae (nom. inval.)]|nr:hypothetical protein PybrP1_012879 [[Pythium] brassicae (nom. inval.)]